MRRSEITPGRKARKILTALLLAAFLAVPLSGCGSGSAGNDPGNGLVPDYSKPVNDAKSAAAQQDQAQEDLQNGLNQTQQTP